MRWTQYFIPTSKETPVGTEAVSHQLLLRAGLVNMLTSGVYSYLPLGLRVLERIQAIIREEMRAAGALELLLPCLQPKEIWKQTGRDATMKDVMICFSDHRGRELCLGPTHEEVITVLVKNYVQSYRQLPISLYQIQTKFRDELRPRFGVVRACEFIMKDAYSFDRDSAGLKKNYQLMYDAYQRIFKRCGLDVVIVAAESGAMGGDVSHEFLVPAPIGEDEVVTCSHCGFAAGVASIKTEACPQCREKGLKKKQAIELGHVFQLGTKYSAALNAHYVDEDGKQKPVIMGCYGIGVSRLLAAIIECHHDAQGILWPQEVAPFDVEVLPVQVQEESVMQAAGECYDSLRKAGMDVLMDDRDESAGRKFNDADLIGIPVRVILGKKGLQQGTVEIKVRGAQEARHVSRKDAPAYLKDILNKNREGGLHESGEG